jgi:protein-arginine kinase activator protein McsA
LDTESLNRELEHAVENEDYRLAAILRDEILKRKNS